VDAWSRAIIPDAQAEDALNLLPSQQRPPKFRAAIYLPRFPAARIRSAGKKKNWCMPLQRACGCPIFVIAAAWTATLAQLRLVELQSVVQLYRALGGGWQ
jgi:hypothetical protein